MRSWRCSWLLLVLCASGCNESADPSLVERLNASQPLHTEEILLTSMQVQGQEHTAQTPPLRLAPGEKLSITGAIKEGTWSLSNMATLWIPDDPTAQQTHVQRSGRVGPEDRQLFFALWIYSGEEGSPEVVYRETVQVQHRFDKKDSRFKVAVPAPDDDGEYAAELFIIDASVRPQRGFEDAPPAGFPIARIPFFVE